MATFYTPTAQDSTNLYYRVKCDYTVTTNNTNVKITATFQMQYKGTYKESFTGGTNGWGAINTTYIDISIVSPTTSKSDWTNVGSSVSVTKTITRTTSSQTAEIKATVDNLKVSTPSTKSVTVTIPALASYSVTYNANGGSGAPSAQKKYYGQTLTLSSTKPTRTGYSFYHWNTNTSNSGTTYNSGASYTGNAALSLYAIWNPIIYYKGNGSSYSNSQTKTYGTNIALLSTVPTRNGYVFDKWNTATDGSGTDYSPGATYTANTTLTLYAQWKSLPTKPKITSLTVIRCDSNGDQLDDGTYAKVTAQWSIDTTSQAYPDNTGTVTGTITTQSGSETSFTFSSGDSGTSGTAIAIIPNLSTDMQYIVKVTVTDSSNSQTIKSTILTRAFFIMDFKAGGEAIGIGRAAPSSGLEIGYTATFDDKVYLYDQLIMGINENNQSTYAFMIGNGTSEDSRSNALTVDWDGKITSYSTNITVGSNPSSDTYNPAYILADKNGTRTGWLKQTQYTDGRIGTGIDTIRTVNGSDVTHGFCQLIDNDGNRTVTFSDNAAWRAGLGLSHILDMVRVTRFQKANVSISANSTASVEMSYTVPTGFNSGTAVGIRFDSENTTSAANANYCVAPNYWVGSDGKLHAIVRNLASSKAIVTVHWYVWFIRNTL